MESSREITHVKMESNSHVSDTEFVSVIYIYIYRVEILWIIIHNFFLNSISFAIRKASGFIS
jgi:hypothetical protein